MMITGVMRPLPEILPTFSDVNDRGASLNCFTLCLLHLLPRHDPHRPL
jgi:hypothetical protein